MLWVIALCPRGVFTFAHIETKVLSTYDGHRSLIHVSMQYRYLLFLTDSLRKIMNVEFSGLLENDRDFIY